MKPGWLDAQPQRVAGRGVFTGMARSLTRWIRQTGLTIDKRVAAETRADAAEARAIVAEAELSLEQTARSQAETRANAEQARADASLKPNWLASGSSFGSARTVAEAVSSN